MAGKIRPQPPLHVVGVAGSGDAREREAWYLALPLPEQLRLRQAWQQQRDRVRGSALQHRHYQRERCGLAVLACGAVAMGGASPALFAWCAAPLVAIAWRYTRADRFIDPLLAVLGLALVHVGMWVRSGQLSPGLAFDVLLLAAIAAVCGFHGEIRATGGFVPSK